MNLDLPTISDADRGKLEQPIVVGKIDQALKGMKSGKAPGPDGFPIEFYKKFSAKLIPILRDVFAETLEKGTLPPTMTQAIISVLHKKDKDCLKCDSYRPISLLSNDYKILTRILSSRLDSAVHTIIPIRVYLWAATLWQFA